MAILKTKEIAERSGVTVLILQRWDNNGALKAYCAPMLKVLFLMVIKNIKLSITNISVMNVVRSWIEMKMP
ncbi:hypothetical protein IR074_08820 [Lactobacillus murinus]|uniref:hypothetical protein n=1 Tax=Ligilactobacillus murinus TaxID=1622 RepID=UPI0002CC6FE8|nr:hypothetical protein [Ligilactobacillus murinus]MBF0701974.1 hypothetical protein [Ligilactobacillus murinus]NYS85745.1 hypothetical protein [Ligilactobacillus murinus]USF22886.1 hypothetical protein C822_002178 [Ligilactobacillus murinus ASF361]